jgi:hypothetical protein
MEKIKNFVIQFMLLQIPILFVLGIMFSVNIFYKIQLEGWLIVFYLLVSLLSVIYLEDKNL